MRIFNPITTIVILVILITSCDSFQDGENSIESNSNTNSSFNRLENHKIKNTNESLSKTPDVNTKYEDDSIDIEPYYMHTPAHQSYKSINLPDSSLEKIKYYFYENIEDDKVVDKWSLKDGNRFRGSVEYTDGTSIVYDLQVSQNDYVADVFNFNGNYKISKSFNEFQKQNIYKILEISGTESPKKFLEELLDSQKLNNYVGCTVRQKKSLYGMIELATCEQDNVTILSLYNPNK